MTTNESDAQAAAQDVLAQISKLPIPKNKELATLAQGVHVSILAQELATHPQLKPSEIAKQVAAVMERLLLSGENFDLRLWLDFVKFVSAETDKAAMLDMKMKRLKTDDDENNIYANAVKRAKQELQTNADAVEPTSYEVLQVAKVLPEMPSETPPETP
jgi:hypothetical protein